MARISAFFVAFGFVLACSSSSNEAPPGPVVETPGTAEDLEKSLTTRIGAFCDRVFNCCDDASRKEMLTLYAGDAAVSRAKCDAGVREWMKVNITGALTAIQRKTLEFYPKKEETCLKDEEAKSCAEFFALYKSTQPLVACGAAFTGKVKEGEGCTTNSVCASGYCKLDGESGLCAKFPEEGDTCNNSNECGGTGLYCKRTSGKQCTFVEGKCTLPSDKAGGQACCDAEECASKLCQPTNKGILCANAPTFKCDK